MVPLAKAFGCARVVYNDGITARSAAYKAHLPFISDATLQKLVITAAKRTPEREWLSEVSSVVLVQALGDLHAAYRNFFASLRGERANGQKLGSHYAVLSNGHKIASPRFFREMERQLRRAQRVLARRRRPKGQPASKNYIKAKIRAARVHAKVRDKRKNFIDQAVSEIVRDNQAIFIEDLAVKGMSSKKGKRGKSLADASLGQFARTLEFQATRRGRTFARVDRWFPSTQACSACKAVTGPKGLAQLGVRTWTCLCGAVHDRDVNAAENIRTAGLAGIVCGARVSPGVGRAVGDEAETRANREGRALQQPARAAVDR